MAFEDCDQVIMDVCDDCVYFTEYGTAGRTQAENESHAARVAETLRGMATAGSVTLTSWCGPACPDHGLPAYGGDHELYAENAGESEGWFGTARCELCGALAGHREHVTAYVPN
jgi:hypothetical protein